MDDLLGLWAVHIGIEPAPRVDAWSGYGGVYPSMGRIRWVGDASQLSSGGPPPQPGTWFAFSDHAGCLHVDDITEGRVLLFASKAEAEIEHDSLMKGWQHREVARRQTREIADRLDAEERLRRVKLKLGA